MRIHQRNCQRHFQEENCQLVQLSLDGVAESRSTSISLDVYSLKFKGCKDIFPVKIVRPINKFPIDNQEQFSLVLESLSENDLQLENMVADNLKRAIIRNSVQFCGKFGCEYCFQSGVPFRSTSSEESEGIIQQIQKQIRDITEKITSLRENDDEDTSEIEVLESIMKNLQEAEKIAKKQRKSTHIVWPANTRHGEPRTREKILEIVEQLEQGVDLSHGERKGIKGRSLLLNLEYFNYVSGLPTEYMHSLALGLVKRMLELCFSVGETRTRVTKRPLTSPNKFNELMKKIKFTRECSRRARKLDLAVMKAQEMRNLLIFFFPLITECLKGFNKEIKLWEMLAFMIRACIIPENEYINVSQNSIQYCQNNFYLMYEQLFGPKNCTYSVHVISSHLNKMRESGPLTETSAFIFEAFYGELRKAFQPGTVSVLKQMLSTVLLKRMVCKHVCEETIYFSAKDTPLECNSLIYVYENNDHVMYKIHTIENDNFICNRLGNHRFQSNQTEMLNWSTVGVYRKGGLSSEDVIIKRENVAGKVIRANNCLITFPSNVLREK